MLFVFYVNIHSYNFNHHLAPKLCTERAVSDAVSVRKVQDDVFQNPNIQFIIYDKSITLSQEAATTQINK